MTHAEARSILARARDGADVKRHSISRALVLTGDLTPFRRQQILRLEGQDRARARYRNLRAPAHLEAA